MVKTLERSSDGGFIRRSPLDGGLIGSFVEASKESMVTFLESDVGDWTASVGARAEVLGRFLRILEMRGPEICSIVRIETGKPEKLALDELSASLEFGRVLLENLHLLEGREVTSRISNRTARFRARPFDLSLLITSYNTPLPNFAWKLFPALLSGTKIILKPSPYTAHSSQLFCDYLYEAGVPNGSLKLANGSAETVLDAIQLEPDLVSLTGSLEAGRAVSRATAFFFPKLILELGGSNPFIVLDTQNVTEAAEFLAASAFSNSGQRCAAGSRLIVSKENHQPLVQELVKSMSSKPFGTSSKDWSGTLVDSAKVDDFRSYLNEAGKLGEVVRLADQSDDGSCLAFPHVISASSDNYHNAVLHQEVFNPILRVFVVEDVTTAVRLANLSKQTLTASVWTDDDRLYDLVKSQLRVGLINRNGPTHGAEPTMPFGGQRLSGNGSKDAGASALEVYSDWFVETEFTQ